MSALIPDALPEGWHIASWARDDGTDFRRDFGPITAGAALARKGRPRGGWHASAILHERDQPDGLNVCMRCEDAPTRAEAMRKAEGLAHRMAEWVCAKAKEIAK